jgi:hypothetical protein
VDQEYVLCLYEDGVLRQSFEVPSNATCDECWKETSKGYSYRNSELTPDGISTIKLTEGLTDGKAKAKVTGRGTRLGLPALGDLDGVIDVQLQKVGDDVCLGSTFSPPFRKNDGVVLKAVSDFPDPATPAPLWSEIHALVIGPQCGGCHGGSGGLSGLGDCNTGHANMVDVPSTRLPAMDRVQPGDPTISWLMHKLDNTHSWFNAMCTGGFCGSQMPLGGPFLNLPTRNAIRAWITNGAENDCP